jgi:molybdate transport system substrate-binding protein
MRRFALIAAICVGVCAVATPLATRAADPLRVLCGGAALTLVEQLARDFERTHGRAVVVTAGTAGQIRDELAAGEPADVVIISASVIDALAAGGQLVDGTRVDLGKTGIGVGIRAGAAAPDLSTPDALEQTLLAAPSIASTDPAAGASSGIYFASVLQKMGIADAVRPKETLVPGGFSCDLVASGKVALCVQNISEIVPVKGVVLAGPFPPALQNYITYSAAVAKRSTAVDDARAFLTDATSPAQAARWASAGFEPAVPK